MIESFFLNPLASITLANIISSVIGNRADAYVVSKYNSIEKRINSNDIDYPLNGDLLRALHHANLMATQFMCQEYIDYYNTKSTGIDHILSQIKETKKIIVEEIKNNSFIDFYDNTESINNNLNFHVLKNTQEISDKKKELTNLLIDSHIDLLKILHDAKNKEFSKYLQDIIRIGFTTPSNIEKKIIWYDTFCAFFNELIKGDSKAKDAFHNYILSELKYNVEEIKKHLEIFDSRIKNKLVNEERLKKISRKEYFHKYYFLIGCVVGNRMILVSPNGEPELVNEFLAHLDEIGYDSESNFYKKLLKLKEPFKDVDDAMLALTTLQEIQVDFVKEITRYTNQLETDWFNIGRLLYEIACVPLYSTYTGNVSNQLFFIDALKITVEESEISDSKKRLFLKFIDSVNTLDMNELYLYANHIANTINNTL